MKKLLIILGGLIAIFIFFVIIAAITGISGYNRLNADNQNVNSKWAQVQNDYQRRADLIPNLVNTVSGAANFEKSTLTDITEARASVGKVNINPNVAPTDANTLAQFDKAQGQLSSALSRLLVVVERYPDLKANANFRDLQAQLEGTENRIAVARRDFNDAVQSYDTRLRSFPTILYAGMLGFKEKPYFSATPGAETAPKVNFDFNSKAPAAKP
ncbi:MAG: LemA family protein [Verrucomicrobiales bacterium]|nr:LemA family protein [Verrucomicrobiales bacterium]